MCALFCYNTISLEVPYYGPSAELILNCQDAGLACSSETSAAIY